MKQFLNRFLYLLFIWLLISKCASRGRPEGGEKDVIPPEIEWTTPENFSTNFKGDEIRIKFNEFVKIKDAQKQLIISPPMDTRPQIYPLGGASRYITIKIKDTLKENTTYAFNFGESIVDNNEENPYLYYRFVFSTGDTIDSLSVKGYVTDALLKKPETFITVGLYEVDSTYKDSVVFKEKPKYVTNTLDSITDFSIDNIKAGIYKLVALKEEGTNYTFQPKSDKIGFVKDYITVPTDSSYRVNLFNEELDFKTSRPKQEAQQRIMFPYEGDYADIKIKLLETNLPKDFKYKILKDPTTDTLYYWYKPNLELDSTLFLVSNNKYSDTLKHRFRKIDIDTLTIENVSGSTLNFNDDITISGSIPFVKIDTTKIKIIDKYSLNIRYGVKYDTLYNNYSFPFEKAEEQHYSMTIYPEAFTDFFDNNNKDTLNYNFATKSKFDYGNIRVNLRNAKLPMIVQLLDSNGEVYKEYYADKTPIADFTDLQPAQYELRAIFDTNGNRKYDSGNFLKGIQPERVSYPAQKLDDVRAGFDFEVEFNFLD